MAIDVLPATADRATREAHAIVQITQRLHARFPLVPQTQLKATVDGQYHRLDGSRVRDFVPIFVERNARDELTALTP